MGSSFCFHCNLFGLKIVSCRWICRLWVEGADLGMLFWGFSARHCCSHKSQWNNYRNIFFLAISKEDVLKGFNRVPKFFSFIYSLLASPNFWAEFCKHPAQIFAMNVMWLETTSRQRADAWVNLSPETEKTERFLYEHRRSMEKTRSFLTWLCGWLSLRNELQEKYWRKRFNLLWLQLCLFFLKKKKKPGVVKHNKIFCRVKAKGGGLGI